MKTRLHRRVAGLGLHPRHWRRRLYRWRRAAGLSVIALVSFVARARPAPRGRSIAVRPGS